MYLYKGVLGTPEAAIAYARNLLRATPRLATMADGNLRAEARDDVWHVTRAVPGATSEDVVSISRINGRMMSGNL